MRVLLIAMLLCSGCSQVTNDNSKGKLNIIQGENQEAKIEVHVTQKQMGSTYEAWRAKNGSTFIILQITIHNGQNTSFVISPHQFNLISENNHIYGALLTRSNGSLLQETRIAAQRSITRILLFEVPYNEQCKKLVFAPNSDKKIEIPIEKNRQ